MCNFRFDLDIGLLGSYSVDRPMKRVLSAKVMCRPAKFPGVWGPCPLSLMGSLSKVIIGRPLEYYASTRAIRSTVVHQKTLKKIMWTNCTRHTSAVRFQFSWARLNTVEIGLYKAHSAPDYVWASFLIYQPLRVRVTEALRCKAVNWAPRKMVRDCLVYEVAPVDEGRKLKNRFKLW